ncbi:hypothetical protein Phum_PHUM507120 [Pediculus humanus corporis]|uniref:Uncharacterized protein n=1 Tax=Pediculus humanus subsp. corporis TaxID=121224 RepID=E0VY02_PEDHC|nr:uncharacterized protein Phum_PHUM507120 [Pediculus humanus corporis]EEB18258.1 hypothetical protein Phum_PHUM507120 [Pediculus humanus corporis]
MEDEKQSENSLIKENYLEKELEKYKKENFLLENEIHRKIWSQRDNFCNEADEFIKEYGILSDRRKKQLMSIRERNKTTFNDITHIKHGDEFINFENDIKKQKEEQNSKIIQSEQNLSCDEYLLSDDDLKDFQSSDSLQINTNTSDNENSTPEEPEQPEDFTPEEPEQPENCTLEESEPENSYQLSPENKLYALMDFDKIKI